MYQKGTSASNLNNYLSTFIAREHGHVQPLKKHKLVKVSRRLGKKK